LLVSVGENAFDVGRCYTVKPVNKSSLRKH
jgi:hypothetical protein